MQYTPSQVALIKDVFVRMKLGFILLMFLFLGVYIYASKHVYGTPHDYKLGLLIMLIIICSLGYLYYLASLVKVLDGNPVAWVLSTILFGPFGLLVSYIVISGNVIKIQRQHALDLEQEKQNKNKNTN